MDPRETSGRRIFGHHHHHYNPYPTISGRYVVNQKKQEDQRCLAQRSYHCCPCKEMARYLEWQRATQNNIVNTNKSSSGNNVDSSSSPLYVSLASSDNPTRSSSLVVEAWADSNNPGIRRVRFQEEDEEEENIYASIRQSNDNVEESMDEKSSKKRLLSCRYKPWGNSRDSPKTFQCFAGISIQVNLKFVSDILTTVPKIGLASLLGPLLGQASVIVKQDISENKISSTHNLRYVSSVSYQRPSKWSEEIRHKTSITDTNNNDEDYITMEGNGKYNEVLSSDIFNENENNAKKILPKRKRRLPKKPSSQRHQEPEKHCQSHCCCCHCQPNLIKHPPAPIMPYLMQHRHDSDCPTMFAEMQRRHQERRRKREDSMIRLILLVSIVAMISFVVSIIFLARAFARH